MEVKHENASDSPSDNKINHDNYLNSNYFPSNTVESVTNSHEEEERKRLLVEDNSWKRLLLVRLKNLCRYFKFYLPYFYFMLISYAGSTLGAKMFKKYIQPKFDKLWLANSN